ALFGLAIWAVPFVLLGLFFLYFFRDPDRQVPTDPRVLVSPADGRVLIAGDALPDIAPPGRWRQISIFLSPVDVHINRVPIAGRITRVDYQRGTFLPAFKAEASGNERTEVWIRHHDYDVVCRQIVGV